MEGDLIMRLSRIYTSKMYLTNPRRDRIHAAINSPENVELVQQFADYLDDDSKEILKQAIKEQAEAKQAEDVKSAPKESGEGGTSEENFPDAEHNVFSPSYSGGSSFDIPDEGGDVDGDVDIFDVPEEGSESAEPEPEAEVADIEESTEVSGEVITADTSIEEIIVDIVSESNVIKGTLNSIKDTAGVIRIAVDDNELWIYYKDEVNIGDIMVDVIETLNGANYTYLTFSRLARSNNAIVFDINFNLQEPVKSINEVSEET